MEPEAHDLLGPGFVPAEPVHHPAGRPLRAEQLEERIPRRPLVEDHWEGEPLGEPELGPERLDLDLMRGEVAVEVEPTLADGHRPLAEEARQSRL